MSETISKLNDDELFCTYFEDLPECDDIPTAVSVAVGRLLTQMDSKSIYHKGQVSLRKNRVWVVWLTNDADNDRPLVLVTRPKFGDPYRKEGFSFVEDHRWPLSYLQQDTLNELFDEGLLPGILLMIGQGGETESSQVSTEQGREGLTNKYVRLYWWDDVKHTGHVNKGDYSRYRELEKYVGDPTYLLSTRNVLSRFMNRGER